MRASKKPERGVSFMSAVLRAATHSQPMDAEAMRPPLSPQWPCVRFEEVDEESNERVRRLFHGHIHGVVRSVPGGYVGVRNFAKWYHQDFKGFKVRPEDTWIVTYPRSGTTWMQELIWCLANDVDMNDPRLKIYLEQRFPFLELDAIIEPEIQSTVAQMRKEQNQDAWTPVVQKLKDMPSPRFIKSHLPFSLLPPDLLDTCKVIYVTRHPGDVITSYYHHNRTILCHDYVGTFQEYFQMFLDELLLYDPYRSHLREAMERKGHPNLCHVTYEDMIADLPGVVDTVAAFLKVTPSEEKKIGLLDHLEFRNFKCNPAVNGMEDPMIRKDFIRRGVSGAWTEVFDEDMRRTLEEYIRDNLGDLGLFSCSN